MPPKINDQIIKQVSTYKYLGVTIHQEPECPGLTKTYQNLSRWLCDGGQNIDTLSREVSLLPGVDVLTVAPARVHHSLSTVGLVQNDQVSLLEGQE